jgi:hypothetical protein
MNRWIALGAACWMAGCASTGDTPVSNEGPPAPIARAGCVHQTGSRISQASPACSGPGRTYSQTDIANTGESTAADALALLDPSITVHR